MSRPNHALFRPRTPGAAGVRPIELFFDLVYVLAITQLTHHLLEHLTWRGAGETLLLLVALWSAWNATSWTTNYFDPDTLPVRLMLVGVMLASLRRLARIPVPRPGPHEHDRVHDRRRSTRAPRSPRTQPRMRPLRPPLRGAPRSSSR